MAHKTLACVAAQRVRRGQTARQIEGRQVNLDTLNLPAEADTAMVWACGREHDLRADAYAWHLLLSDPARSETEQES